MKLTTASFGGMLKSFRQHIQSVGHCSDLPVISVPVLFQPQQNLGTFGKEYDDAVSAYANLVNGLSLNEYYYTAKQPFTAIADHLSRELESLGITTRFLNADLLHQMGGGIHCWTQAIRSCQ